MSEPLYRHTQVGHVVRWILRIAALFSAVVMGLAFRAGALTLEQFEAFAVVEIVAVVALLVMFGTLTVTVDRERVEARFGPGPLRFRWRIADVRAVRAVRTSWWWGYGIRLTPRGWLFNVSGSDGVELELANGKRVTLGTDEPLELVEALEEARV